MRTNAGRRMQHTFANVPTIDIPRSTFNRSHGIKTTMDAGLLVPFFADEVVPGDTINVKPNIFARLNTPLYPIIDNMTMDIHFWAVPLRLVWENFQKFMGEQENPGDSTDFLTPLVKSPNGGFARGGLFDYLGFPPQATAGVPSEMVAFWSRAYNLIWNEWYRDENLQDSVVVPKGDADDAEADFPLLRRGKRHDYFTSSLPWPQKGDAVSLPLGTTADVLPLTGSTAPTFFKEGATATAGRLMADDPSGTGNTPVLWEHPTGTSAVNRLNWAVPGLYADLSSATAATINQLREAYAIQTLLERDARSGTRYTEIVRGQFRVTSPDARLQRPEFLGGGSLPINITPVPNTAGLTRLQGELAAFGVAAGSTPAVYKSFTEHCVVLGLVSVRADLSYQQGVPRMFSRRTRYDFYWPALAGLGEQAVLQKEIYLDGTAQDATVWGYQERWAEMRYKPSLITGTLRSSHPQSLDVWHLAQEFGTPPALNDEFIQDNPPIDRVVGVPSEPQFLLDGYIQFKHIRPMPIYSVPSTIGRW